MLAAYRWTVRGIVSLGCCAAIVAILHAYPLLPWPLAAAVAVYAAALACAPALFLLAIPAVLSALDLSMWTGWTTVGEADLFVLATVGVLVLRTPLTRGDYEPPLVPRIAVCALLFVYIVAFSSGLAAPRVADPNSVDIFLTPENAWRLAKGPAEAFALLPFMFRRQRTHGDLGAWLARGIVVAVGLVAAETILERGLFVHLMDLETDYRVVGPFSSMRIGGGHIGAFFAMTLPFVFVAGRGVPVVLALPWLAATGAAGLYALVVTFARAAYAAVLGNAAVVALGLVMRPRVGLGYRLALAAIPIVAVAAAVGAAAVSPIMRERFARLSSDLLTREDNWSFGLTVRDQGAGTTLFGAGLGTYPRAILAKEPMRAPTDLAIRTENGHSFVRIVQRTAFYLGQKIDPPRDGELRLRLRYRTAAAQGGLGFSVCEKLLLYSENCVGATVAGSADWRALDVPLRLAGMGGSGPVRRPIEFSLFAGGVGTSLDIENVVLTDADGRQLLANGDFSHGIERWLFTDDDHLAWRMKNMYLMSFFETGALGLAALIAVCAAAFVGGLRLARAGDPVGGAVAGAVVAFLVSGTADNVLEVRRLTTLFLMICWVGIAGARRGQEVEEI